MKYKKAYIYIFNKLTEVIKLMDAIDPATEYVDIEQLLKHVQVEAEKCCIE